MAELVIILDVIHVFEHFTFAKTGWSKRGKQLETYVKSVIAVERVTAGTNCIEEWIHRLLFV